MRFTSHTTSADGITERGFVHVGVPGVLWTPSHDPAGLALSAHSGQRERALDVLARDPGMEVRARRPVLPR
ncbi:hypothetical protein [Lentzea californiensis]|uniref:hypothetical protein n=1 Tax=Lentzea californiensis TaxID=438851 RepID=UPI00216557DA|nr:hypothetical protein [Lentzea californiensis]